MKIWSLEVAVFSSLRRAHRNSPEYRECLKRAKSEYFIDSKKGKKLRRVHFKCAQCGEKFFKKLVQVDHKESVIPLTGKTTYDMYIKRLFCGVEGLQVLCKQTCHRLKTKAENAERRKIKKAKITE